MELVIIYFCFKSFAALFAAAVMEVPVAIKIIVVLRLINAFENS